MGDIKNGKLRIRIEIRYYFFPIPDASRCVNAVHMFSLSRAQYHACSWLVLHELFIDTIPLLFNYNMIQFFIGSVGGFYFVGAIGVCNVQ